MYEDIFESIVHHQTDWNQSSENYLVDWLKIHPVMQQTRT